MFGTLRVINTYCHDDTGILSKVPLTKFEAHYIVCFYSIKGKKKIPSEALGAWNIVPVPVSEGRQLNR